MGHAFAANLIADGASLTVLRSQRRPCSAAGRAWRRRSMAVTTHPDLIDQRSNDEKMRARQVAA
jgi:hypothetical protein